MICSNCNHNFTQELFTTEKNTLSFCPNCRGTHGKNREGFAFMQGTEATTYNYHPAADGRVFVIKDVFFYSGCESGTVVFLIDKETQKPMKSFLDVNWLKPIMCDTN